MRPVVAAMRRLLRRFGALPAPGLFLLFLACLLGPAQAQPVLLAGALPIRNPLGPQALYLQEAGPAMDLDAAQQALRRGAFQRDARAVASYGIGARPVWAYLEVVNPTTAPLALQLAAGMTWVDRLDVYLVRGGQVLSAWHTGDAVPGANAAVPALGYAFPISFAPGRTELFVRAQTLDPLLLPLSLLAPQASDAAQRALHYGYGMFYGFLLACVSFTGILYLTLRTRTSLYYGLYLLSFMGVNLCYTGHGLVWWWPAQPEFQRYVILVAMVVFGCCGFLFATRFLDLKVHAPVVKRWVERACLAALALVLLCAAVGSQLGAALVAFNFLALSTVGMVALGLLVLHRTRAAGRYFLGAVLCGMTGAATTTLSVWGWLPMNALTFRGVEIGVLAEALLLGLALALRAREHDRARKDAEILARTDTLTGLPNRRAFLEMASGAWSTAMRRDRPLSVVMLDIDHFKSVNDRYGHDAGDAVLVQVARLLAQGCRAGDIPVRWGGEEFVLLLPETDSAQAQALAERLREAIGGCCVAHHACAIALTASLGVAERKKHTSLVELIADADQCLYHAKREGRNRVAAEV